MNSEGNHIFCCHGLFACCVLSLLIAVAPAIVEAGGKIDSVLSAKLESLVSDEFISVRLKVSGGISAAELERELDATTNTLDERRRLGLRKLRSISKRTQEELLLKLRALEASGAVRNIQSRWLSNEVSLEISNVALSVLLEWRDVERVYEPPEFRQIEAERPPVGTTTKRTFAGGVEPNIRFVDADSAWRMGYTGEGRVVAIMDYHGIEGDHPALSGNWKGNDGDAASAWLGEFEFPTSYGYHGSHVLGIMIGHDDLSGDTIGVAPDAVWIGTDNTNFEWLADPDGDPSTTADMPDVLNISLYTFSFCYSGWWEDIDMLEALGTVVIIAAGNFGPDTASLVSPASRALDSLTNFAVGSVDPNTSNVWFSSSRGPSNCGGVGIKPNMCAPGPNIRSSIPDGLYEYRGGTSMAAPHVAGAVAILRQFAPNTTAREIKQALLAGATPRGSPFPNNDYGWGILNIPASLEYLEAQGLSGEADLRVHRVAYEQVNVSDTLRASVTLMNRGFVASGVYALFDAEYSGVSVLTDSLGFGSLARGQQSQAELSVLFDDTMFPGPTIPLEFTIHSSGGSVDTTIMYLQAGREGERSYYTHKTDRLHFTVSNYGQFGFGRWSAYPQGYSGFSFQDTTRNELFEAALLMGTDSLHVSDGFRTIDRTSDNDFWYDAANPMIVRSNIELGVVETESVYDDGRAERPLHLTIVQKTYNWESSEASDFVTLEYEFRNDSKQLIDGLYVGLAFDWLFPRWCDTSAESGFIAGHHLGYLWHLPCRGERPLYRGLAALNDEGCVSYVSFKRYHSSYPGLGDSDKFAALAGGIVDTGLIVGYNEQPYHIISTGPFSLRPGESDTAVFALVAADSLDQLIASVASAARLWRELDETVNRPESFALAQNYPNPFNAATTIRYALSERSRVRIDIFNILGQRVTTLVDDIRPAGNYSLRWSGVNQSGGQVASGVYLYRLRANGYAESRKMILLK